MSDHEDREAKLKALREAAQVGIADLEAGRYKVFESTDDVRRYFNELAEQAIARGTKRRRARHTPPRTQQR